MQVVAVALAALVLLVEQVETEEAEQVQLQQEEMGRTEPLILVAVVALQTMRVPVAREVLE